MASFEPNTDAATTTAEALADAISARASFEPSTDAELDAIRQRSAEENKYGPRAEAASFDPTTGLFRVTLKGGGALEFGRDKVREFDPATDEQLRDHLSLSPSGLALVCEPIDMHISLEGLALDLVMGKGWRLRLRNIGAREMGKAKSPLKAAAVRENGKKGGRPRKVVAETATGQTAVARAPKP